MTKSATRWLLMSVIFLLSVWWTLLYLDVLGLATALNGKPFSGTEMQQRYLVAWCLYIAAMWILPGLLDGETRRGWLLRGAAVAIFTFSLLPSPFDVVVAVAALVLTVAGVFPARSQSPER